MTMIEETGQAEVAPTAVIKPRPLLLSLLCVCCFVYFFVLTILFILGIFNTGWITHVMNQYLSTDGQTNLQTGLILGSGFVLHGVAFAGIWLIWKLRKTGYYFLGVSCLIICAIQLLLPSTAITSTAVYIVITFLFGLFYNRLH
jgi:hypothetical protein